MHRTARTAPPELAERVRPLFPALARREANGGETVFLDGPAGSQTPARVADAVRDYLLTTNANHGGDFATSRASDALVAAARADCAAFVGAADPEEVVFGANMTTLAFHLARSLGRTWRAGDEIAVTDADHDANVLPWVLAARDAGAAVQRVAVRADGTVDVADAEKKVGPRCRLFAFGAASNLTGTVQPAVELAAIARRRGALSFVDAVHWAPHARTDVAAWGCDFAACSAYKFFGPHLGLLWGRRALLEELEAYKVRPAADRGAEKWQTGTANFEAIAGTRAAVHYLASLATPATPATPANPTGAALRAALDAAFRAIHAHEAALAARLLDGLRRLDGVRVVGVADPARAADRCPTVAFVHPRIAPRALARALGERGIACWAGNSYAIALTTALGLEPHGVLRVGLLHYNTAAEVDRFLAALAPLLAR